MKLTALILFGLLVGALGYTWEPEELECAKEQNVDKKWIEENNNPLEKPGPIDNQMLNDFLECTWKKQELLTNDGIKWDKFNEVVLTLLKEHADKNASNSEEVIAAIIAGGLIEGAIDKCRHVDVSGTTPGQTCAKAQNCVGEQLRDLVKTLDQQFDSKSSSNESK